MNKKLYDLTNPQKSIWLTEQYYKDTVINNLCGTVNIDEKVDFDILCKSIQVLLNNNDSFKIKLCFDKNNNICQYFDNNINFDKTVYEIKDYIELKNLEKEMTAVPFSLINSQLFEFKIFKYKNGKGGFIVKAHHLICDACTAGLIASKVMSIYSSLMKNEELSIASTSYTTYISSENEYLNSEKFEKDKEYWNSVFETIPEIGTIPSILHESNMSCKASRKLFILDKDLVKKINDYCLDNKISAFNFFMGIYAIYIGRVSNLDDFVLGTPILNRSSFVEKNTPGMFISTVPFRFTITDGLSFIDFVKKVGLDALCMFRHQKYPYQNILEDIRKKNPSQPNLYDILISYQNTKTNRNSMDVPYSVEWTFNDNVADSMQIHLFDMNDEGKLNIAYDFREEKYEEKTINAIHERILYIVNQVLNNKDLLINNIEITTPEEKDTILNKFNNTYLKYDKTKTIIDYFEDQVSKTPDSVALVFENQVLTYEQLNKKANILANYLRSKKIKNNSIVGIMMNRSFDMIIAILGVLKSGGSYIPIDPEYPEDRISYMLSNSKCKMLLSNSALTFKIKNTEFDGNVVYLDLLDNTSSKLSEDNLKNISKPNDLSYIIYTSGSTGNPKGVMLTQQNLSNFVSSMMNKIEYLNDSKQHSIVSITTVSFDIFLFETLVSLCFGLKVFITNESEQKITLKLEELISKNNIDIIQSTPSIMNFHLENSSINGFSGIKYVMLAGEQLPKKLVEKIKNITNNCTIYNGYGPSETTIFSTVQNVTNLPQINIGNPIHNTQIYILDKNLNLLPPNTIGEIYIAGDGVGLGYLNSKDLTSDRYISNPYIKGSIMYKSGDIGFWLDNGSIDCRGRIDHQIKLRGLRIELEEIEDCINSFDKFSNTKSAVIIKEESNKTTLNAFIASQKPLELSQLKEYLSSKLPLYMIPNSFTILESLPYTPNGKIDRKSLQYYNINYDNSKNLDYTPARNKLEQMIIDSIKRKLNINDFGIDNNVFDYGADSLSIINILTDLFQYDINLKVYDFYQHPTVRQLYDSLLQNEKNEKKWEQENFESLNSVVNNFSTDCLVEKTCDIKSIFITGVTGFLGIHILADLLDNINNLNKIYCSVRKKDQRSIQQRLLDHFHFYYGTKYDKLVEEYVVCIDSDISKPFLGIKENDLHFLKNNINCVIHSAAIVKHYGNYAESEKINIYGTNNIIEFCKLLNVPLHYISTMTIFGNYLLEQCNDSIIFDENSFYKKQAFYDNVYAKSKLIAEYNVINSIKDGLSVTVYRVGDLTGRYCDGKFQKNIEDNSIYLRLKSLIEIGIIPDSIKNNQLEFTPVEYAAKAITSIIWSNKNKNRIFHIYNPNMIKTLDLIKYLKNKNININFVSMLEFKKAVKKLSTNEKTQKKLKGIINDFTNKDDLIYNHIIKTSNEITCKYLHNIGFDWPNLNNDYFDKLIEYMISVGFIK